MNKEKLVEEIGKLYEESEKEYYEFVKDNDEMSMTFLAGKLAGYRKILDSIKSIK